jgi:hypothetical protein
MHGLVRSWVLVLPLVLGAVACDSDDCEEPPGTFEPVDGCQVELNAGEDVFAFCVNRPGTAECGGPDGTFAQGWLVSLQNSAGGSGGSRFPTRVGCGPLNPNLVPSVANDELGNNCCYLMVYDEPDEENCVETAF